MIFIKNAHIKTIINGDIENGSILIGEDGRIAAIGENIEAPEGAEIIDAKGCLVTPGIVEAHCHTGLGEPLIGWAGNDINEGTDPITPHMRAIDGINPLSPDFEKARRGGVTSICVTPGSANVIGGTAIAIKTYGNRVDDMVIKDPVAMKCAFGENPKRVYGQELKRAPKTRMATAALLRETLMKACEYSERKDAGKDVKFDIKLEALVPVVKGELPLKAHAHRADDIFTAIRIAKEFNLKMTLDHCTDGHLIADQLAKEGYPAIVGPSFCRQSKAELENKDFETAGVLCRAGVTVSITTDSGVTPIENISTFAGMAVGSGLDYEEAWKAITINPARALTIHDRVGSLEVGKDADVVIWTADPLTTVSGKSRLTIIDGKIVYRAE